MIFQGGFCKEPLVLFGKAYLLPSTINCPGDVRHLNERTYFFPIKLLRHHIPAGNLF